MLQLMKPIRDRHMEEWATEDLSYPAASVA